MVDLDTDLVLAAVIYEADRADTETLAESVVQAQLNVIAAESPANIEEGGSRQRLPRGRDGGLRSTRHWACGRATFPRPQPQSTLEVERAVGG